MYDGRMERICALLCLQSSLCRCPDDPPAMTRSAVRSLLSSGVLDGLVLRDMGSFSPEQLERVRALLSRASSVCASLERYREKGMEVLLPDDAVWPARLEKLGKNMPLYLFAIGNQELLCTRTIAVAGSRAIRRETREIAARIGAAVARQGLTVVSGGAQGIDLEVERAALNRGGSVVIVPAMPVSALLKDAVLCDALKDKRALILCETPPEEAFSAQKALTRNHTIYALGSCALVVAAREGKGGSWAGAKACIAGRWSPVYVLDEEGEDFRGNAALLAQGAHRMMLAAGEAEDELFFEGLDARTLEQYGVVKQMTFDLEAFDARAGEN